MKKYRGNKNTKVCNLYLLKNLIVPVICVFLAGAFSKPAESATKNPDDVAKLQKFVDAQVKKGAKLSKDVENDKCYKWDKNGNLKSIKWRRCKLTGNIKLPEGKEMVMPGDHIDMEVELITPIAMDEGLRFAIREGGRTVGSGVVSKINK